MKSSGELTVKLLQSISKRLSSRKNCRRIEYVVCIGMTCDSEVGHQRRMQEYSDVSDVILFFPEREVFPDKHHRRSTDLIDIVSCVITTKFKDTIFAYVDNIGQIHFQKGSVVPGVYKYILSSTKKRRKWVRIK